MPSPDDQKDQSLSDEGRRLQTILTTSPAAQPAVAWLAKPAPPLPSKKRSNPSFRRIVLAATTRNGAGVGLVLETMESVLQGGEKSGPAAIAGKSKESLLILHLRGKGKPRMPMLKAPLS